MMDFHFQIKICNLFEQSGQSYFGSSTILQWIYPLSHISITGKYISKSILVKRFFLGCNLCTICISYEWMINFKRKKSITISKTTNFKCLFKVLMVFLLASFVNIPKFLEYGDEGQSQYQTELRLCKD